MKNSIKTIIVTATIALASSSAYAGTYSDAGYNNKLVDEVSERGGFNEKSFQSASGFNDKSQQGGFNDKGLAKDVNPGWKKY